MLFKYLIGTIALAATVMSSPTAETTTDLVAVQKTSYQKCITTITEVKQPVVTSCKTGKVEEVKAHLKKVYTPVAEVSTNYKVTGAITIQKPVIVDQSHKFIEVLKKFEEIFIVIHGYEKISAGCTEIFVQLNIYFESICVEFKKHGIDIYKTIKESSLTLTVWTSLGFKFYSSK